MFKATPPLRWFLYDQKGKKSLFQNQALNPALLFQKSSQESNSIIIIIINTPFFSIQCNLQSSQIKPPPPPAFSHNVTQQSTYNVSQT